MPLKMLMPHLLQDFDYPIFYMYGTENYQIFLHALLSPSSE